MLPRYRRHKATNPCFDSEAAMGAAFVELLKQNGYSRVYPELLGTDVVAVRDVDDAVIAFELKLKMNTKVVTQAESHRNKANGICCVVNIANNDFGHWLCGVCRDRGTGVFIVERNIFHENENGSFFPKPEDPPTYHLREMCPITIRPNPAKLYRSCMSKRAETHTVPGAAGPTSVTAFRATAYRLIDAIVAAQQAGMPAVLKQILETMPTHYAAKSTAKYRLKAIIEAGGIPGVAINHLGEMTYVEPRPTQPDLADGVPASGDSQEQGPARSEHDGDRRHEPEASDRRQGWDPVEGPGGHEAVPGADNGAPRRDGAQDLGIDGE